MGSGLLLLGCRLAQLQFKSLEKLNWSSFLLGSVLPSSIDGFHFSRELEFESLVKANFLSRYSLIFY